MPLLALLYPFLEIWAWWNFISAFGWGDALLWCLTSAALGLLVLKAQGPIGLNRNNRWNVIAGAILLILPGLLTDVLGALLILPGTGDLISTWFQKRSRIQFHTIFQTRGFEPPHPTSRGFRDVTPANLDVIEAKATVLEDEIIPIDNNSKKE